MFAVLIRYVGLGRHSSATVYESCLLSAKCDRVAAFRLVNGGGVNALSTSPVWLCEKRGNDAPFNQDEKTTAKKEIDQRAVLKANRGSTSQQQTDAEIEQDVAKPTHLQTVRAKTGKESLLDLLGAMKVEVTSKRKLKNVKKAMENYVSAVHHKLKPEAMESTISMFQKATEMSSQSEKLDPDLVAAASAAASTLPNQNEAVSELLRQLRQRTAVTKAQKKGDVSNLGMIITNMKVGKKPNRQNAWPANQIQFDDGDQGYKLERGICAELSGVWRRKSLFTGKRLNIFSPTTDEDEVESALAQPTLWDMNFANELSTSVNQVPRNGFEEMIQWTKEGKLWQYPVNNEAGLEEEATVPFHEHIFLEKHLEEGFPRQGPVRHFMELVVVGLSRNPYLTVQQKKEHIFWFRDYFQQKEEVLKEAGVSLN
ncbi:small ribosomal subunit protein mS31 [Pholidichthys leucotaenia]